MCREVADEAYLGEDKTKVVTALEVGGWES